MEFWIKLKITTENTTYTANTISNIIRNLRARYDEANEAFDENGEPTGWVSWSTIDEDVKDFSVMYPDFIFELTIEDNENRNESRYYFMDGKMQLCEVTIIYEAFNKDKLA